MASKRLKKKMQKRKDSGVPINDAVQKELIAVRDELGLTQYKFPFEY